MFGLAWYLMCYSGTQRGLGICDHFNEGNSKYTVSLPKPGNNKKKKVKVVNFSFFMLLNVKLRFFFFNLPMELEGICRQLGTFSFVPNQLP